MMEYVYKLIGFLFNGAKSWFSTNSVIVEEDGIEIKSEFPDYKNTDMPEPIIPVNGSKRLLNCEIIKYCRAELADNMSSLGYLAGYYGVSERTLKSAVERRTYRKCKD